MIAVPALVYAVGAYGFFALPYTIIVYPFVFAVMPLLWKVAHAKGHVTAADVVHGTYSSRGLELAVAVTGIVATMPYIALQLIGMGVVIKAIGLTGELPIVAAFVILALYTYSSGLRAPALIAFVKDIMIYIVVLVAVVVVPAKLGGYGAVFDAADDAFTAKGGATGLTLKPPQMLRLRDPRARLGAGGLHVSAYADRRSSRRSRADTIRKNAILLPAYTLLLGLIALLGYMAYAAGIKVRVEQRRRAAAVQGAVPVLVRRLRVLGDRDRRAGAGRGHEHRRGQPVHAQFLEVLRQSRISAMPARRRSPRSPRWSSRSARWPSSSSCRRNMRSICNCSAACGSCRPSRRWCSVCSRAGSAPRAFCSAGRRASCGEPWTAWSNGLKPLATLSIGGTSYVFYVGLGALILNVAFAVVGTLAVGLISPRSATCSILILPALATSVHRAMSDARICGEFLRGIADRLDAERLEAGDHVRQPCDPHQFAFELPHDRRRRLPSARRCRSTAPHRRRRRPPSWSEHRENPPSASARSPRARAPGRP